MYDSESRFSSKHKNKVSLLFDNSKTVHDYALWHHRLGHAPMSKLRYIVGLSLFVNKKGAV